MVVLVVASGFLLNAGKSCNSASLPVDWRWDTNLFNYLNNQWMDVISGPQKYNSEKHFLLV